MYSYPKNYAKHHNDDLKKISVFGWSRIYHALCLGGEFILLLKAEESRFSQQQRVNFEINLTGLNTSVMT
jgi:hypothetical protein